MSRKPDEFEAGGVAFQLSPMLVKDARKLYPLVLRVMQPVVVAIADYQKSAKSEGDALVELGPDQLFGMIVQHLPNLATAAEQFSELAQPFETYCKVKREETGDRWLPLDKFLDEVFQRKHGRQVEWLGRCIMIEFGDFLGEFGLSL
jgi:hypothetical protein